MLELNLTAAELLSVKVAIGILALFLLGAMVVLSVSMYMVLADMVQVFKDWLAKRQLQSIARRKT